MDGDAQQEEPERGEEREGSSKCSRTVAGRRGRSMQLLQSGFCQARNPSISSDGTSDQQMPDQRRGNPVRPRTQENLGGSKPKGKDQERIQAIDEDIPFWLRPFPQPGEEEEEGRDEEEEECEKERKMKVAPNVRGPTPKEWEDHQVTHGEYRDWCEACVAGSGRFRRRSRAEEEEGAGVDFVLSTDFTRVAAGGSNVG